MKFLQPRLLNGKTLLGTMVTLPSPEIAELLALAGFDWLFVDGEHGPMGTPEIQAILQAVGDRTACLVRVPSIDEQPIKHALDLGAAGIIIPQVNSANDARKAVEYCRYPPFGKRGIGLSRAHGYGTRFKEYLASANDQVCVVLQAEHRQAVENIDAIVEVPGIDCILIGPNDLSASYGKLGQFDDPEIVAAIQKIEASCKAAGIPLGIFGVDSEAVQPFVSRGYQLIVAGVDVLMLGNAAQSLLKQLKNLDVS